MTDKTEMLREAVERFIADYDDGDVADAGDSVLMEMHVANFRGALSSAQSSEPSADNVAPIAWLYAKNGKQSLQFARQPWLTLPDRGWTETPLYSAIQSRDDGLREALKLAVGHLDHMAAWISKTNEVTPNSYSFESLGEDMPGIRAALARSDSASIDVKIDGAVAALRMEGEKP